MVSLVPIAIGVSALSLYFYLTGIKGLIVLVILFMLLMALIYWKQNMLLYMPVVPGIEKSSAHNPKGYRHPSERNLTTLDVVLNTSDGVTIRGWHVKAKDSSRDKRIVIYFHENAGNIGTRIDYMKEININTNSDVILVAYRGYSDSQSIPSESGIMRDSYAVMEYALAYARENNNLPIYVLGRSLGGAVTVNLATQQLYKNEIKGIILQNTFTCIGEMIDVVLPALKYFKFLQRNHWASIDRIASIKAPTLFIKSMQDELVPPEHMHRLMDASTAPIKREYRIKYGTHNSAWDVQPQVYFANLSKFFAEVEAQK